jgi:hypothetical protein
MGTKQHAWYGVYLKHRGASRQVSPLCASDEVKMAAGIAFVQSHLTFSGFGGILVLKGSGGGSGLFLPR